MAARMPEPTHQWMHNEETGGDWECPVGLVEAYEQRGWVRSDGPLVTDQHLYDDPEDPRIKVVSSPQAPAAEQPVPPKKNTKADLITQAENLGLPTDGTKAELTARIAAALQPPGPPSVPGDPGESTTPTTEEQ